MSVSSGESGARARDIRPLSVVARGTASLLESLPVVGGRARTRQILKAKGVRVLRLSLDVGQAVGERVENAAMLIQVLEGRVTLTAAGERLDMPVGAIVHLERQAPHSISATVASHLMITLLAPRPAQPRDQAQLSHQPTRANRFASGATSGQRRYDARASDRRRDEPRAEWASHNLVLAATGANAVAFDAITHRHAELLGRLAVKTARLLDVLAGETDAEAARQDLLAWVRGALLPQLALEAEVLYPVVALRPQQRALVVVLREQLASVTSAVARLADVGSAQAFDVASAAVALRVAVGRHLAAEAESLLPTLAISSDAPLAALWERMNERLAVPLAV